MIVTKSLGVSLDGTYLRLSLLARRFNKYEVRGLSSIQDCFNKPEADLRANLSSLLSTNDAGNLRCVLAIPRHELIIRRIELPKEAEANLPKVVEYQLLNLVPSEQAPIYYDFQTSKGPANGKTFYVDIFLVLKSVLDSSLKICERMGLSVSRVVPSSIAVTNYMLMMSHHFSGRNGMVGYWSGGRFESNGLLNEAFLLSRSNVPLGDESEVDVMVREAELFRGQMGLQENSLLNVYLCSDSKNTETLPSLDEQFFKVKRLSLAGDFGVQIAKAEFEGRPLQEHFLSIVAAFSGLRRRPPSSVNLLPLSLRKGKPKWLLVPTYVLLGINLILLFALVLRKPIQQYQYHEKLVQETSRLEPEVKKIRSVEKQITDLQRRTDLLIGFQRSNTKLLVALNELSTILPKTTYLMDLTYRNQTFEIYGLSDSATALPQIIDNSPQFRGAEFIAPITRDGTGKEIFRIRMQLKTEQSQASSSASNPDINQPGKNPINPVAPRKGSRQDSHK
ncbi:MAG TPA: PilN domain-containing protein [Terriglobia bacterium]|nr:PilN domain-containing protein [Terriglobia bacterium]